MRTLANSEDLNEMLSHAAFWQGLQCSLSPSQFSEKEIQFHLENITCVPFNIHWTIASLLYRERSDSVVEWTRDRGVVGWHCVVSLSRTHLTLHSTGSIQEAPS